MKKKYLKAIFATYTLIVVITLIVFCIVSINWMANIQTDDYNKFKPADDLFNSIIPFMIWIVVPYFIFLIIYGLYFYISDFIIKPLKEGGS